MLVFTWYESKCNNIISITYKVVFVHLKLPAQHLLVLCHHKGSLLASGILFFRVRLELICWDDSRLCHWATGRRGLDNISAQCLSWFPAASQPRNIFPMASFRVTASWSQTEITKFTLCGQGEELSSIHNVTNLSVCLLERLTWIWLKDTSKTKDSL